MTFCRHRLVPAVLSWEKATPGLISQHADVAGEEEADFVPVLIVFLGRRGEHLPETKPNRSQQVWVNFHMDKEEVGGQKHRRPDNAQAEPH